MISLQFEKRPLEFHRKVILDVHPPTKPPRAVTFSWWGDCVPRWPG